MLCKMSFNKNSLKEKNFWFFITSLLIFFYLLLFISPPMPMIFLKKSPGQTLDQGFIAKKTCNFLKKHLECKITSQPIVLNDIRAIGIRFGYPLVERPRGYFYISLILWDSLLYFYLLLNFIDDL